MFKSIKYIYTMLVINQSLVIGVPSLAKEYIAGKLDCDRLTLFVYDPPDFYIL